VLCIYAATVFEVEAEFRRHFPHAMIIRCEYLL
jgi:hypothetical protein